MWTELKGCPYCGGEVMYEESKRKYGSVHSIFCRDCGVEMARLTLEEVIEAWNRRV